MARDMVGGARRPPAWKEPARRLRRRFEAVDRWATYVETEHEILTGDPVLIFSMGKVGTTSLESAVAGSGRRVLKAHALSRDGIRKRLANERALGLSQRPRFLWRTQVIRQDIRWRRRGRWQIVAGVRDPVARAMSAYFYRLSVIGAPVDPAADLADHYPGVEQVLDEIVFNEDWFADELRAVTGLDVYAEPFDAATGFQIYSNTRFRAVVFRQEDLSSCGSTALSALLGEQVIAIAEQNTGDAGSHAALYDRFRREFAFDPDVLSRVYNRRICAHFYSPAERAQLLEAWCNPQLR